MDSSSIIKDFIIQSTRSRTTGSRPTIRWWSIFPYLRSFVKSTRLETRGDNQTCGVHRRILRRGREINDPTHHLGISLVNLGIIVVDFFHGSKDTVTVYLFVYFQYYIIKFSITLRIGVVFITTFSRRTQLIRMIVFFRFQCGSCIDSFLASFHCRIQSLTMFLISFRSQIIHNSRSRLDCFIQTILSFLSGQRFLIQHISRVSNQSLHSRLRTGHIICTQISHLEIIKQCPICGQRLRSRRHFHTETEFSIFTHITFYLGQITCTIGHDQLSTLLTVADIFAFQVRTSGCQLRTIFTYIFILQTICHVRHAVISVHISQHVVSSISFNAPSSRPSGISRRTIESLHTNFIGSRR